MAESAARMEFQREFSLTIGGRFVVGDEIMEVIDPEDALRRANDTRYGLSGSVWTRNWSQTAFTSEGERRCC